MQYKFTSYDVVAALLAVIIIVDIYLGGNALLEYGGLTMVVLWIIYRGIKGLEWLIK